MQEHIEYMAQVGQKASGSCLGGLQRDVGPPFGQIRLGGVRQAEGERLTNSFLPRLMIRAGSKSLVLPAARSASPR